MSVPHLCRQAVCRECKSLSCFNVRLLLHLSVKRVRELLWKRMERKCMFGTHVDSLTSQYTSGNQRLNVSKYVRSVINGFLGWFWAVLKTAPPDGLKVSGGFFVLTETVRYTLMGSFESSKTCTSLTFIRKLLGKFWCYTEIFRRPFKIIIAISW